MRRFIELVALGVVLLGAAAGAGEAQTTIQTDGDVEAEGFIGDGSQLTDVDAELLDGMDSSAFAQETDLQDVEVAVAALLAQLPELGKGPLARTGQTTCYSDTGAVTTCRSGIGVAQDGHLQLGVNWPNPRFTKNGDGTVTDELTGLIWLENADCADGEMSWSDALDFANTLFDGSVAHNGGDCGLSDGSTAGAWRLPNVLEQQSLVHYGATAPAIPNTAGTGEWVEGDPFTDLSVFAYWSSTTVAVASQSNAWTVSMANGHLFTSLKIIDQEYVWPVRDAQ